MTGSSRVGLFASRLESVPHLAALLDAGEVVFRPPHERAAELDAVLGWARGEDAHAARAFASAHGLPLLHVDDGFLRSVGTEAEGAPPLSLLVDDLGVHDDPSQPSRLERLLEESRELVDPALLSRAARLRRSIVRAGLSRTNRHPAGEPPLSPSDRPRVVVVHDEPPSGSDDARQSSLALALEAALHEHPRAEVRVLGASGVALDVRASERVHLVSAPTHPHLHLADAEEVYVTSSLLGLDALLLERPVRCLGAPFYAGWGLTRDLRALPRRTRRLSLDALVAGALLLYPRYVDPERGTPCEAERVVEHLALQRAMYEANARRIYAFGFSAWKRSFLPSFLESPGRAPIFVRSAKEARSRGFGEGDVALVWGAGAPAEVERLVEARRGELWRMEDGFLRSVRLGAEIASPASLVVDTRGIYFDPRTPSDLEILLETAALEPSELARAAALREAIVNARVSKYNVGSARPPEIPETARGRVVLVPGQVEDDASIRLGGVDVKTNLELLREARRARPDAFIVYKPHPDVWGGHRRGALGRADVRALADLVVTDHGLPECLEVADEVHTITSLVGFEALLRGLRVSTYGLPFYAGWGLTEDRHRLPRRTRRRSVDELVACALIRYPRYRSASTGAFASPEHVLAELERARREAPDLGAVREGWLSRNARKLRNVMSTLRNAR